MKYKFRYKGVHSCEAVVLACIDFRFWKETMRFVEKELGIKIYDFPKLPGAAKTINECASNDDMAMKCIDIPCRLHQVRKVVIVNHADCGAYGGAKRFNGDIEAEQRFHEGELRRAGEKIRQHYPGKEVILVYAKLVEEGERVEFLRINN